MLKICWAPKARFREYKTQICQGYYASGCSLKLRALHITIPSELESVTKSKGRSGQYLYPSMNAQIDTFLLLLWYYYHIVCQLHLAGDWYREPGPPAGSHPCDFLAPTTQAGCTSPLPWPQLWQFSVGLTLLPSRLSSLILSTSAPILNSAVSVPSSSPTSSASLSFQSFAIFTISLFDVLLFCYV